MLGRTGLNFICRNTIGGFQRPWIFLLQNSDSSDTPPLFHSKRDDCPAGLCSPALRSSLTEVSASSLNRELNGLGGDKLDT